MENDAVKIIDCDEFPAAAPREPLPENFGYQLDTIEKARQWLTHPQNWIKTRLFILKWDGLVPRINEEHGRRLIAEPWDDGLPWAAVYGQRQRREKDSRGEELDEKELPSDE